MGRNMENQLLIAALKAHLISLNAELNARIGYTMNHDFQLECRILNKIILKVEAEIKRLSDDAI